MPLLLALLILALTPALAGAEAGDLDTRFGPGGRTLISLPEASTHARALAVQRDGKVLVAGTSSSGWLVTRLRTDGRPDRSFGRRGRVRVAVKGGYGEPFALLVLPDGRILVGGTPYANGNTPDWVVVRLLRDGRPDPAWGSGGSATVSAPARAFYGGMAVQPDGGVVVTAAVHDRDQWLVVMRLGPDGRRDLAFGDGGTYTDPAYGAGTSVVARPDGRLLVGGQTGSIYGESSWIHGGTGRELVLALTAEGRPDTSWGRDGRFVGPERSKVMSLVLAPDGGVVALDAMRGRTGLLSLTADGRKREDWGLEGRTFAGGIFGLQHAMDRQGRVYVAGDALYEKPAVARVTSLGVPDRTFGQNGIAALPNRRPIVRAIAESVAVGAGDRIYVAASGANMEQDEREDFGYTHAVVARLKGWDELSRIHGVGVRAHRRRLTVMTDCTSSGACRLRVEVLDRRRRIVGRLTGRRIRGAFVRNVHVTMRRRARRGERLTVRLRATAAGGQTDSSTRRITVR